MTSGRPQLPRWRDTPGQRARRRRPLLGAGHLSDVAGALCRLFYTPPALASRKPGPRAGL